MPTNEQREMKSRTTPPEQRAQEKPGVAGSDPTARTPARRESRRELTTRDPFFGGRSGLFDTRDIWKRLFDPFDRSPFASLSPWTGLSPTRRGDLANWMPQIESFQRGDEFVVRADLPGLDREDITVDVQDDALVVQGERHNEHEHEEEGSYASERSYGQFCRVIPLPEGAIADSVKATFKNGVLEVVTKAPPHEVRRGRRVEIA